jgi:hypothetical protein
MYKIKAIRIVLIGDIPSIYIKVEGMDRRGCMHEVATTDEGCESADAGGIASWR